MVAVAEGLEAVAAVDMGADVGAIEVVGALAGSNFILRLHPRAYSLEFQAHHVPPRACCPYLPKTSRLEGGSKPLETVAWGVRGNRIGLDNPSSFPSRMTGRGLYQLF